MKVGWEYKTLGEVGLFISGYTPKKNELNSSSGTPYFKVSDMNKLENQITLTYSDLYIKTPKKIFPKGSIVFPKNGGAIYTEKKRFLSQDSVIDLNSEAIFADENYIIKEYLFYFLSSIKISSFDNGGGLPSININRMKECSVPLPNIDEQRRIVSYLDSSFKLIDEIKNKALKSLTEAKALFQSALAEAMEPKEGWEEKTLGEVSENIKNINWKNESSAYKYIDLSSVDRDKSIILNTVIVNKTNAPSRAKQLVNKNDIIFATTRPLLRRVTLIEKEYDKSICSTGFCVIRPNSNIIVPKYVFYVFKDEPFYQYIEPLQNGASYPAVTDKAVKSYTFSFPKNVEVQKQIVSRLDKLSSKVRAIEEKYQKMVEECDALKQAMCIC